jgi:hypothetical protein
MKYCNDVYKMHWILVHCGGREMCLEALCARVKTFAIVEVMFVAKQKLDESWMKRQSEGGANIELMAPILRLSVILNFLFQMYIFWRFIINYH